MQFHDREKERDALFAIYSALSPTARLLAQISALIDIRLQAQGFLAFAEHASVKDERGGAIDRNGWKQAIKECRSAGVIENDGNHICCVSALRTVCSRHAATVGNLPVISDFIQKMIKQGHRHFYYYADEPALNFRMAIVSGEAGKFLTDYAKRSSYYYGYNDLENLDWMSYFGNLFDPRELQGIPYHYRSLIMRSIMEDAVRWSEPAEAACAYLQQEIDNGRDESGWFRYLLGQHLLLLGRTERFDRFCPKEKLPARLLAMEASIKGENARALACFDAAFKEHRKLYRKQRVIFEDFSGVLYLICLIRGGTPSDLLAAHRYVQNHLKKGASYDESDLDLLGLFSCLFDRDGLFLRGEWHDSYQRIADTNANPIMIWLSLLTGYWLGVRMDKEKTGLLAESYSHMMKRGFAWIASEMAELLFRLTKDEQAGSEARRLREAMHAVGLTDLVRVVEPWERTLDALKRLAPASAESASAPKYRFIWRVHLPDGGYRSAPIIEPVEQKVLKNGTWNVGKRLDVRTLAHAYERSELLTDQDRIVINTLERDACSWSPKSGFQALAELAGHPAVYRTGNMDCPLEIKIQEPCLSLTPFRDGFKLSLEPPIDPDEKESYVLREETKERIVLFPVKKHQLQIARILNNKELTAPAPAKDKLMETLAAVATMITVHNHVEGASQNAERVEADARPLLRLSHYGQGLKIELFVRPLPGGRLFLPGSGTASVYETIDKKAVYARRDLKKERTHAALLLEECPTLAEHTDAAAEATYIDDPSACLSVLSELKEAGESAVLLWNDKKPVVVSSPLSFSNLSLRIRPAGDWFGIDGELRADDGRVIAFRALLDLLDASQGRFLPLDENRYITLTREFRRQLERLRAYSGVSGGETRLHPLAALALQDLADEMPNISLCDEWKTRVERMRSALTAVPPTPKSFAGELRDYQREGFVWLVRLAELGAGACLADDMGLGKTIQAIALLLRKADKGPALVIAPTSVCTNWTDEIGRFAPVLKTLLFAESDRETAVKNAGPFDVVVCSYGLVNTESALLSSRSWSTIILDEAQAIKNMATQRSKAVMELRGDFRLVTTGTPVENHLGELWNIFRFINNGLLGTIEEFNRRFAVPIERDNDADTKHRLKTVIGPFILRRLKNQVLDELPPRTEVVVHVDMSDEEKVFYEALRRKALDDLSGREGGQGQHIRILAHIMKLRRACCSPTLVAPECAIPGSKLEAFGRCIDELIENNHRALVFSQFVGHLSIVKAECDRRSIEYQYLDGGTPARERSGRIDAFQRGKGVLFLMSLKAGGVGVNLTAADYVLLLDPWWNPAVEDQAAARAYRIGQRRPVTVYRFITRGTIEEKIVDLHKHKRDLAESLLEGGDMSGKISAEDLLELIRDTAV